MYLCTFLPVCVSGFSNLFVSVCFLFHPVLVSRWVGVRCVSDGERKRRNLDFLNLPFIWRETDDKMDAVERLETNALHQLQYQSLKHCNRGREGIYGGRERGRQRGR